jgi:undecaprenyl-diphosphatase
MNWFQALVLGAVQGLTEFLPVSSSGHLVLFQNMMHIGENPLLFDTLLHVGTLVAVVIFLWKDIVGLVKHPIRPLMLYLIIATIPAVLAALLFGKQIEAAFGSNAGIPLGLGFLVSAAIMFATPLFKPGKIDMEKMGVLKPFLMGIAQAVAILPSVSRSGATIFTGVATDIKREDVARFSFLMSIPAILGSVVLNAKDIVSLGAGTVANSTNVLMVLAGMVVAALTGYLALKVVIDTIKNGKLWVFGIYTTALGLLIIFDTLVTHIIFKTAF